MKPFSTDDTSDGSSGALLLRLLVFPTLVGICFICGVYWLRLQFDAAAGTPETTRFVEVHLLPRPNPVPIPVSQAPQSAPAVPVGSARGTADVQASVSDQDLAALPAEEPAAAEPSVPSDGIKASSDPAPNSVKIAFRSELLRHIARFQRYPKAAESRHLEGTVHIEFSLDRNGRVVRAWVKTSSGEPVLDAAAIDTIRRAQPMPAIPSALPGSLKIEIALGFDPTL